MARPQSGGALALRWRIVTAFEACGSIKGVAKQLGCSPTTVRKWVARNEAKGDVSYAPRAGRPNKGLSTARAKAVLKRGVRQQKSCRQLMVDVRDKLGVDVSMETVRRALVSGMARQLRPKKKPLLTEAHKEARLRFAKTWVKKRWDNVVVTDNKYFWLCPKGVGSKVWVLYGDKAPIVPAFKNCTKLHVYGGVALRGRTPLFAVMGTSGLLKALMNLRSKDPKVPKGVNSKSYVSLLDQDFIPACITLMGGDNFIFQQDNARARTAKHTKEFFAKNNINVMEWPALSPDLSWIESIWAYVAMRLHQRSDLTAENFFMAVNEEWNNIPNDVYRAHYYAIKRKLHACIEANGGNTKY